MESNSAQNYKNTEGMSPEHLEEHVFGYTPYTAAESLAGWMPGNEVDRRMGDKFPEERDREETIAGLELEKQEILGLGTETPEVNETADMTAGDARRLQDIEIELKSNRNPSPRPEDAGHIPPER